MTPGRKFSTTTSAVLTSLRKISLPSSNFRFRVSDFLLAFWARKLVPISCLLSGLTLPSLRARSPPSGFSILITSAPSSARCMVANGPERTLVRSRTRTFSNNFMLVLLYCAFLKLTIEPALRMKPGSSRSKKRPTSRAASSSLSRSMSVIRPWRCSEWTRSSRADVAGRHLGEGAAAQAAQGRLEILHAGPQGGIAVGQAQAVGVVEMAGQLDLAVALQDLAEQRFDLGRDRHGRPYRPG